ncbi:MAG: serine/threonine-protein kinase [Myxococcales bacterium]|nr:serine/threonine-protein kinase [Myxococcota bacterium]MDW8281787.1 serine/threonine-protein kinase [Myxococcales bacterium]
MPELKERPIPPRIGDVLEEKYRLTRELGRGAMGAVYLADDLSLERQVAVKVLLPEHAVHPGQAALFRREARLLAAVQHENVVRVHALGEHRGAPFLVMEYITGPTLANYLVRTVRTQDAVPLDIATSLSLQLCRAVQIVHAAGIIHRDIKPANVMVAQGPRAILMDFGLAKSTDSRGSGTHIIGTPDYLAPELIRQRPRTPDEARRCDVYSLGMTIYELMAGKLPFPSGEVADVLRKHLDEDPVPPSTFRPDLPHVFDQVILKAVARDPLQRYQTCDELLAALMAAHRRTLRREPTRVLVADENPEVVRQLRQCVEAAVPDVEVVTASDGEQVLQEAQRLLPSLLIMDLSLPKLNGVEVCATLRGAEHTSEIPVVVMSARSSRGDRTLLRQLGVRAVVPKPMEPDGLSSIVRAVIREE